MAKSKTQRLRDQGFDLSYYSRADRAWRPKCSNCQTLVINGMACHETGCSNEVRS